MERYQKGEKLGEGWLIYLWCNPRNSNFVEGTHGIVYKAVDRETGETVALKRIRLDREDQVCFALDWARL